MTAALRGAITDAVIDPFRARPFDWDGANCITLAHAQAVAMGHDVPDVPRFKTVKGALRALKKQGANSTAELLDQWFERHEAPAFARVGDLVLLPGETDLGARDDTLASVGIADGRGNIFAWHPDKPDGLAAVKWAQAAVIAGWKL